MGVALGVSVGVGVGVALGTAVGVAVLVGVGVGLGVGVQAARNIAKQRRRVSFLIIVKCLHEICQKRDFLRFG